MVCTVWARQRPHGDRFSEVVWWGQEPEYEPEIIRLVYCQAEEGEMRATAIIKASVFVGNGLLLLIRLLDFTSLRIIHLVCAQESRNKSTESLHRIFCTSELEKLV